MATPFFKGKLFITQRFGERPEYYKKYGLAGHNGLDVVPLDAKGKKIMGAPFMLLLTGTLKLLSQQSAKYVRPNNLQGWYGYGAAWVLRVDEGKGQVREFTFGHLKNRQKSFDGDRVKEGTVVAQMGNTGDSSGDHLHITMKVLINGEVQNYGPRYKGARDPLPFLKKLGIKFANG